MNINRNSYPPGYGQPPLSQQRQGPTAGYPARKIPYWNPQLRGNSVNDISMELGSQGPSSTLRKRVNVACARCRKRKIRCSGDPGDNSGCQNCRTAGIALGQCQFLRVQCEQLAINEHTHAGSYDRFGQQLYVGSLTAAHYACLSAPPVANGDASFESQLQIQRATEASYASMPSLHPSRSLPDIAKRKQILSQSPEESGLALLARNAEAVSNLPTAVTYALATGSAAETLAAVATPAFAHWSSSTMAEGLRAAADDNPVNDSMYFDTGTYATNPVPQIVSNVGLIPTSNVRSNSLPSGYGYNHLANIPSGASHMTLALHSGKNSQISQTLPNEKCETITTQVDVPYTIGFADGNGEARFSRIGAQALSSSSVDTYSVPSPSSRGSYKPHLDLDAMSISKSMHEVRDSGQPRSSLGGMPSNMFFMTQAKRGTSVLSSSQENNSRGANPPVIIERRDLMSPPAIPVSRPVPAQATMMRVPTNLPSTAGCGSSVGSPKYIHDSINFTDSAFARPMKASH
ncbi:hypothetical protein AOL_s00193g32 [Orbilia oligospora ATCC 24927]|uniref:Zn(2)-C6 fungal-type domain-containing protein n=1 Tax=Arthrobotrys oligospora (strain ATCC 24927 / CBS 115.81 / DSM 1491) TaxID=756982 RepID=G1XR33_ARTOA|nr:hypothetical protein AOL_s00193g32 [Orbilia oligospora ATCC 24927]EGX44304.1 hypothetical protein AOL_s00193g32 [Orbilia oligospora ATCC 24927]